MAANFPTDYPDLKTDYDSADEIASGIPNQQALEINAIGEKVGKTSDSTTTTFTYKLSGVTGSDKAASKAGTEIFTNKTLSTGCSVAESLVVFSPTGHDHTGTTKGGAVPEASVTFGATGHDHTGTTKGNLIPTGGIEDDAITAAKIETQEAWNAPTLLSSWVNYVGAGDITGATAGYFKDSLGIVHLKGLIKDGTIFTGTTICTLPAGYRPLQTRHFASNSVTGTTVGLCCIRVVTDGNVDIVVASGNVWLALDTIQFPTF